jgi:hypothetical protein
MFVFNLPLPYFPAVDGLSLFHEQFQSVEILELSALDDHLLLLAELANVQHNKSAQVTHLHLGQLQLSLLIFVGEEGFVARMNQLYVCYSREYFSN